MNRPLAIISNSFAIAVLCLALQACSSSGSSSSSNASSDDTTLPPFSAPVNAATLSAALTTETAGISSQEFWACGVGDGNTLYTYSFVNDGAGVETDFTNANAQSVFTWQATSATSMVLTEVSTGEQFMIDEIQFAGRDSMSLLAPQGFVLECERDGASPPAVPVQDPVAGTNSLSNSGAIFPLTHGFEEAFSFSPDRRGDTHRIFAFDVADAVFTSLLIDVGVFEPQTIWRPNFATVWFRADLHSPGAANFTTATFQFESDDVDENGPEVAGRFFFNEATFGIDVDGVDGIDADTNEFIDAVAGTITITRGEGDQATISFDVSLEDGTTLRGNFSGLFPLFDRS